MEPKLMKRSEKLELLKAYTDWLLKNGYADTDVYCEPPTAIDQFSQTKEFNQI